MSKYKTKLSVIDNYIILYKFKEKTPKKCEVTSQQSEGALRRQWNTLNGVVIYGTISIPYTPTRKLFFFSPNNFNSILTKQTVRSIMFD